jgi:hypothetical protein
VERLAGGLRRSGRDVSERYCIDHFYVTSLSIAKPQIASLLCAALLGTSVVFSTQQ